MDRELLDTYWQKVKTIRKDKYLYRNIYNGMEIELWNTQINAIIKGDTSVSKIITRRIGDNPNYKQNHFITNNYIKKGKKYRALRMQGIIDYGTK